MGPESWCVESCWRCALVQLAVGLVYGSVGATKGGGDNFVKAGEFGK